MASLDLLSLSSAFGEGSPNVVGEAMACGVPCVVTDVGDAAWIVGETGTVVPPRSPAALADAWSALLALGADERARLGVAARRRIEANFALSDIIAQYEHLYEELVAGCAG
jgi:glycosyltransferase involved in cell wall biosynthesis